MEGRFFCLNEILYSVIFSYSNCTSLTFFQQRGQAAIEINRLRCSTGNSPTDSSNRNGSLIAGTPSSPVDKVSLMYDNVSRSRSANRNCKYSVKIESNFPLLFVGYKIGEGKCSRGG